MRIRDVSVDLLKVPVAKPYHAAGRLVSDFWHVLARVTTDDGVTGFGYGVSLEAGLMRPLTAACRELGAVLVGAHVLEPEAAWERLRRAARPLGPGGLVHQAMAPLDIALWDAAGKSLGQPLYRLLGGARDRLPAYASDGFWYGLTLDELAAAARGAVERGFSGVKLRIGREADPAAEAARVAAVRAAVGPDIRILADANSSWDETRAMRAGRLLGDLYWLEDPVPHENVAGLAALARRLDCPVATGEQLYQVDDFVRLFEARTAAIAIVDLGRIGGITPWRRVAALAHAHGIPVCGHVLPEVHIHLLCGVPNGHLCEVVPRSEAILESMPVLEGGALVAPSGPGLGTVLKGDAVARYRVDA